MNRFMLTYDYGGHSYTVEVVAGDWKEAEARLRAIGLTGRVDGRVVASLPGWVARLPGIRQIVAAVLTRLNERGARER